MASPDLRKLLLKVQTDADFYNLLLVDPEQALTGYEITPAERDILLKRNRSISSRDIANGELICVAQ